MYRTSYPREREIGERVNKTESLWFRVITNDGVTALIITVGLFLMVWSTVMAVSKVLL